MQYIKIQMEEESCVLQSHAEHAVLMPISQLQKSLTQIGCWCVHITSYAELAQT